MKIKQYLSAIFITLLLAGCSDSNREGECGLNPESNNVVNGYSNQVCEGHRSSLVLTAVGKGFGKSTVPNGDEAKEKIEQTFTDDLSASQLREETNAVMSTVKRNYNNLFYLYATILVFFAAGVHLISWMTHQEDFLNPGKKRYNLLTNCILTAVGAVMLMPWTFEGATEDENTTVADYLNSIKLRWGNMLEAEVAGNAIASQQVGDTQVDFLSDSSKKYAESYFKANAISFGQIEAKLTDNRTTKLYFELHNLSLPVGQRKIEFTTPPTVFPSDNGYVIKRMLDGEMREDRAIAQLYTTEYMSDSALDSKYKRLSQSISANYQPDTTLEFNSMLSSFKSDLMAKAGLDKSNKKINSAVSIQASKMISNVLANPSDEKYELISSITRLVEEYECSDIPENLDVKKKAENYVKYVKGEIPNAYSNASIACVGEDKSNYYKYGTRTRDEIKVEMFEKYKKLVELNSLDTEANEVSIVMNTVDSENSKNCIAARKQQDIGFALYYPSCIMDSQQNKEIIQTASSNYKFIAEGAVHYVDTNYELKNNNLSSEILNTDYTQIMSELFNSVEVKFDFNNVNKQEYVNALISGNLGDEDLMTRSLSMFLNPASHFEKTLGLGKDCDDLFYKCMNSGNAYVAIYQLSENMYQLGTYIAFGGIISGMADSKVGKMKDKSSNFEYSGSKKKGILKYVSVAATVVKALMDFFQPLAIPLIAAAIMLLLVMLLPTLIFIGGGIAILLQAIVVYIIGPVYYIWMFWANDRNNIKLNLSRMFGEAFYMITIKSVFILLQVAYYYFFGIVLFMQCYALYIVGSADLQSAVVWSIVFVPVLYLTILNLNQVFIDILKKYGEVVGSESELIEIVTSFVEKFQSATTLGLPLTYLFIRKRK